MQIDVGAQLCRDINYGDRVLKKWIRLMGGCLRVVIGVLLDRRVSEERRELLPKTLWNRIEWIPITWFQD